MIAENPAYMAVPLLTMPQQAQFWALCIHGVLALFTFAVAARMCMKAGSPKPLLYVLGAVVCGLMEPLEARLAGATHAQIGQWTAYEALGVHVPVWVCVGYIFYNGFTYLMLVPAFIERTMPARRIWMMLPVIPIAMWLYETPLILSGLFEYKGPQPFQPFPELHLQPLWWAFGAASMLLVPCVVVARLDHLLVGWRQLFLIPIIPSAMFVGAAAVCWPSYLAINSPAGMGLQYVAASATILMTVLVYWLLIPFVSQRPEGKDSLSPSGGRLASEAD